MNSERITMRAIFSYLCKRKGLSAKAETKEINDVESPGAVNERRAQNAFRQYKKSDKGREDKKKKVRKTLC